jgi:DNA replication protein DnaC
MQLSELLEYLSDKPNYDKLNFISDEWEEENKDSPWVSNLYRESYRFFTCEECQLQNGNKLGEAVCPEALPIINAESSNFYKKIIISDKDCKFILSSKANIKTKEMMGNSGLTLAMQEKTLTDFDAYQKSLKDARDICTSYVESFLDFYKKGVGIFLYSETPGNGKSHLSIATAMDVYRNFNIVPKYCNLVELNNTYKSMLSGDKSFSAFAIVPEVYKHEGLLIIDDIGTEIGTQKSGEIAYAIVHYRYDHNLPTIFTSNYSLDQLKEKYLGDEGIKIVDRIRGRCHCIKVIAPSWRSKELDKLINS